jgi:acetate kinase
MGLTPLQGLIMGTRSGDIDPEIVNFLSVKEKLKPAEVIRILNKKSGLKGVCGESDVRTVHKLTKKNKLYKLALEMFAYRITEYVGAYFAALPKVDAIVFTAGIGQGGYYVRKMVCDSLANMGVRIDSKKNRKFIYSKFAGDISARGSKVKVLVIPTNEELMIAKETAQAIR